MIDKRKLYGTLYKAFHPESIVAFATTKGYRVCKADPQMVDYDVLYAIDPQMESKTWIQITEIDKTPRVVIKKNDFFVVYNLGDTIESIEQQKPSYREQPEEDQIWIGKAYTTINQAFVDAGYQFP